MTSVSAKGLTNDLMPRRRPASDWMLTALSPRVSRNITETASFFNPQQTPPVHKLLQRTLFSQSVILNATSRLSSKRPLLTTSSSHRIFNAISVQLPQPPFLSYKSQLFTNNWISVSKTQPHGAASRLNSVWRLWPQISDLLSSPCYSKSSKCSHFLDSDDLTDSDLTFV